MLSQTHWLIGNTVAQFASEQMPGKINKWAFCWGSVLPDLVRPYNRIPHTIKDSEYMLIKLLDQIPINLCNGSWAFSIHLGIMSHFISDYFCLAHNDPSLDAFIPHAIYEAKLHSSINGRRLTNLALATLKTKYSQPYSLGKYLKIKHQDYKGAVPGPGTDVAYALQAVMWLILSLPAQAFFQPGVFRDGLGTAKTA